MKVGFDRLAVCLALGGIVSGLTLAVLIVLVLLKHVHPIPWYDRSYFALLICAGLYALTQFVVGSKR